MRAKKAVRIAMVSFTLILLTIGGLALRKHPKHQQQTAASSGSSNKELLAKVQKLNEELDRLQATNDPQKQAEIFADDIVQMNPNHPMIQGKEAVMRMMTAVRKKPVRIVSSKTHVINAWQSNNMIFEYGTTVGALEKVGETKDAADPGDFFLAWVSDPAARNGYKVQFSIWNTTKPVAQTNMLAVGAR